MTSDMKNPPPESIYGTLERKDIRLATIAPSSLDSAVRVTLRTVQRASVRGKYYCLSYAWGDAHDEMPIMINGRRRMVRCNLYSLLRRLRNSKRNQNIWIDAICINQLNDGEKASQVSIMQSIYSEAAAVLIGLDDSRSDSISDIPAQHALAAATFQGLANDAHLWKLDYFVEQSWSDIASREKSSSFGQVLSSRWFGRSWVVQETCLAKKAVLLLPWGDLDWDIFSDAFLNWNRHSGSCCREFVKTLGQALDDACNSMYLHVRCIADTREGLTGENQHIIQPMLHYQHLAVTDVRDKVHAFRGLHTDLAPPPQPDYKTDSEKRTFVDFTLWYLEEKQSLLLLSIDSCFGKVEGMAHLPSWVPTWPTFSAEQGIMRSNIAKARCTFLVYYSAAPGVEMIHQWDPASPDRLQLNGNKVNDKIIARSQKAFTGTETFDERVALTKEWYKFAFADDAIGHDSLQHMQWAFCVTMLTGIVNEPSGPRLIRNNDVAIKQWKNALTGMERDGRRYSCTPFESMLIRTQDAALLDRVMFRTEAGRLGLGPRHLEPGDELYLLGGGNAPFLLRPDSMHAGSLNLIGHCYLHGFMHGELGVEKGETWVHLV